MPAREQLEDIAQRWISLWCMPTDWDLFDELHDDAFQDMSPADRGPDKDDFAFGLMDMADAFPDLRTTIEELVVDTDRSRVAIRWVARGTLSIPPHVATMIKGIEIIEIANGRITRRWGEWDISGLQARGVPGAVH